MKSLPVCLRIERIICVFKDVWTEMVYYWSIFYHFTTNFSQLDFNGEGLVEAEFKHIL